MNKRNLFIGAGIVLVIAIGLVVSSHKTVSTPVNHTVKGTPSSIAGVENTATQTLSNSSTTFASLYNNDGRDRIITKILFFTPQANTSQSIVVATSSLPYYNTGTTIVTWGLGTSSVPLLYATSTNPTFASITNGAASSTVFVENRIWKSGTFLNFIGNGIPDASTTVASSTNPLVPIQAGFAAVSYIPE